MRKPEDADVQRDSLIFACAAIIVSAIVIEVRFGPAESPVVGVVSVLVAAFVATGLTVQFRAK